MKNIRTVDNVKLSSIKRKSSFYKMHSDTINNILGFLCSIVGLCAFALLLAGIGYGVVFLFIHYILVRVITGVILVQGVIGVEFLVYCDEEVTLQSPMLYLFLSPYLSIWKYFKSRTARRNRYYIPLTIDELRSNNINTVGEYLDNTKNLISWKDGAILRQVRINENYKNSIYMNIPNVFEGIDTTIFRDVMKEVLQENKKILSQEEIRTEYCEMVNNANVVKERNNELDRLFGCRLKEEI